ncbi:MAG: type I DNA topoisomerase, partial [Clostridia bacterium]|nr:type I DNA topoisomerase [Clostridia bacterium]
MATTAGNPKLVIVESPAKARTIEKFLGKGYRVEASQGHVRDLPKSQIGVDTQNDFDMKYITIRGRGSIVAKIKKEAKNASCIYLATDPDREGEAISWHLAKTLDLDTTKPCRIEFHEITKKAVKDAIDSARPIDMKRVDAQQARRALDRLVGYKISPLLWAKVKKGLSAGRVQSVATRMVVEREQEIESFIPEEFWDVLASSNALNQNGKKVAFQSKLVGLDHKKASITNKADALSAKKRIEKAHFTVQSVKRGEKLRRPQPPFTTSSLQQEASRKLNFSTAKTMQVVQQLYEGINLGKIGSVGLVTYIRTDSVRVSAEAVDAVRAMIKAQYGEAYCPAKPNEYKGRKNIQDAHEAIRPTYMAHTPEAVKASLTKEQYNLYRLIYTRFVASQMRPAVFQAMTLEIGGDGVELRYYGEHMTFAGYRAVYVEGEDDEQAAPESIMPALQEGDRVEIQSVEATQHFTQPPSRYSEASLVKA